MFIAGEGGRSHVWPAKEIAATLSMEEWDRNVEPCRREVVQRILRGKTDQKAAEACWEKTLSDCESGYCEGLICFQEEVSKAVGSEKWVPTPRFPLCTLTELLARWPKRTASYA